MDERVTIVAPFRQREARVGPFRARVNALEHDRDCVRVLCVEGDSTDGTREALAEWARQDRRVCVLTANTGGPLFGSVVDAQRFRQMAQVCNAGLAAVDRSWSDYVLMLPSDIVYGPEMLGRLLAHAADLVSPLVFIHGRFYDVWAFTRKGKGLPAFRPDEIEKVFGLTGGADDLVEMDTVGGTLLMRKAVVQAGVKYREEDADRGLCIMARARGFRVWADVGTWVRHPAQG